MTPALGIGATTAVFSVVNAVLLRPLPYRDPGRLVGLNSLQAGANGVATEFVPSQPELVRWRTASSAFEAIEAHEPRMMALSGSGDPEVVPAGVVTSGLFPMLGVAPRAGRVFTLAEERSGATLAVVSSEFAERHFAGAPPLGKSIVLDSQSFEIVGMMPSGFHPLLNVSQVWIPLNPQVDPSRQGLRVMQVAARLRPGVTYAQAQQQLQSISAQLAKEFPTTHGKITPVVKDLRTQLYGKRQPALVAMGAAVLLLLTLACVNVLNLTLGHLATRRGEMAIRAAIGGGRWRLARLQLVQTSIITLAGGALGVVLATWVLSSMLALARRESDAIIDAGMDWRLVGFAAIVTLAAILASGLLPAMRAHASTLGGGLIHAASERFGGGVWEARIRAWLVVAQVALSVFLLCGAGVFLASLRRQLATNPGFVAERVWSGQIRLSPVRYSDKVARARAVRAILEKVAAIPGVAAAGTTQSTFLPDQSMQTFLFVEGLPAGPENVQTSHIRHITPGYFPAIRVPVVEGRAIDERDQMDTPPVCMVSARFARDYWPQGSALGHRIRRNGAGAPWLTVVGVVQDVMDAGLGVAPVPTLYVPYFQQNTATARVSLLVRAATDSTTMGREIERAVWTADPQQPVDALMPLGDLMVQSAGDQRFRTILLATFAAIGLLLALVGVYGVTSAAITARTWETGVRMALGATPQNVMLSFLTEFGSRVLGGAVAGTVAFIAAGRGVSGLLYNTSFTDPAALAATVAPLLLTALAVTWMQARQLGKVSPLIALRG